MRFFTYSAITPAQRGSQPPNCAPISSSKACNFVLSPVKNEWTRASAIRNAALEQNPIVSINPALGPGGGGTSGNCSQLSAAARSLPAATIASSWEGLGPGGAA